MADASAAPPVSQYSSDKAVKRWFPLESNPEVMNSYSKKLGLPTDKFQWVDVLSTEEWALGMVPQPVQAVVLLFPIKEKTEEARKEQAEKIASEGQEVAAGLYYTKQTVGNACGTVGILHSVANLSTLTGGPLELPEDSWFADFVKRTLPQTPEERAQALEDDQDIEEAHESTAQEGQSEMVEDVNTHFVAFVHRDGHLYELDGRKATPVNHGSSSQDTLLVDACKVIQAEFMAKDPTEMRFTLTALAPAGDAQ